MRSWRVVAGLVPVILAPFAFADMVRHGLLRAAVIAVCLGLLVSLLRGEWAEHKARQVEAARIRAFVKALELERFAGVLEHMIREAPLHELRAVADTFATYGRDGVRVYGKTLEVYVGGRP